MKKENFENIVKKAILEFPEKIRKIIDNVAICIEEKPSKAQLTQNGIGQGDLLLGLYEGVPKNVWGRGLGNNLPDKITIFQSSIESLALSKKKIKELVKDTVWHEIAHHFGFSEKGVKHLTKKRSRFAKIIFNY